MTARELSGLVALLSCVGCAATAGPASAAAGDLDSTFGGDGIVTTRSGTDRAIAIQANGRIVVAGTTTRQRRELFALARFTRNGALDAAFSSDGRVTTRLPNRRCVGVTALAIARGGKIVAAGRSGCVGGKFALVRYLPSGRLDRSFSGDGRVTTSFGDNCRFAAPGAMAIQRNGRIVVAGRAQCTTAGTTTATFALARYTGGGRLDRTFSGDGRLTTDFTHTFDYAYDVLVAPGGKIVAAGTSDAESFEHARFALARYTASGALDRSFGIGGKVMTPFTGEQNCEEWAQAYTLARQPDGALIAAGTTGCEGHPNFALARYTPRGTLDPSFGGDGRLATLFGADDCAGLVNDLAIRADGRIIAGGAAGCRDPHPSFALARYRRDGRLDAGFGGDGKVTTTLRTTGDCFDQINAIGLRAGRIMAVGAGGCASGAPAAVLR
ncbi:MAG: hypothetical protein ACRDKY_09150, partial [Solirubrobacteraceae bacterium]